MNKEDIEKVFGKQGELTEEEVKKISLEESIKTLENESETK